MTRIISEYVRRFPFEGAGLDAHGNETKTWGSGTPVGIFVFDPGASTEPTGSGHQRVVTTPTLYMPPDSPFCPLDRCEARGKMYEVDGEPAEWVHPDAGPKGSVVKLKRVTG